MKKIFICAVLISFSTFMPHLLAQNVAEVVYSTYYGKSGTDDCDTVAVDQIGNAYMGCHSNSTHLAGSEKDPYRLSGGMDAFIVKINSSGDSVNYIRQLGGEKWEAVQGITVDKAGNVYAVGSTYSANFPTTVGAAQETFGGESDAFVVKLDPTGKVVWTTYFGGKGDEDGRSIFLDNKGSLHIVGRTTSADLQTTEDAVQTAYAGDTDAFIASFDLNGLLQYSTYLGGTGKDIGFSLSVSSDERRYISGTTDSVDFPIKEGVFSKAFGNDDVFVAVLNKSGSTIDFSSYVGGSGDDRGYGLEVDLLGNIFVSGHTTSPDLKTTEGAFQPNFGGQSDAFVVQIDPLEQKLNYLTYLGGKGKDRPRELVIDSLGQAIVVGQTSSTDFYMTDGKRSGSNKGDDGFVVKLNTSGTQVVYSFVSGGSLIDIFEGVAVQPDGTLIVSGLSSSLDFSTKSPLQAKFKGGRFDIVVFKLKFKENIR